MVIILAGYDFLTLGHIQKRLTFEIIVDFPRFLLMKCMKGKFQFLHDYSKGNE